MALKPWETFSEDPQSESPGQSMVNALLQGLQSVTWRCAWVYCSVVLFAVLAVIGIYTVFRDGSPVAPVIVIFLGLGVTGWAGVAFVRAIKPLKYLLHQASMLIIRLEADRRIKISETDFIKLIAGQEVSRDGVTLILADIGTRRIAAAVQFQLLAEQRTNLKRPWLGSPNYQGG